MIKIPHLREEKEISTLLTLSAAIALLLASQLLPLSNFLLQPVQAQSNLSFRTPTPAKGNLNGSPYNDATLTFDAQGITFVTPDRLDAHGTYKITGRDEGELYNGSIGRVQGCCLTNDSNSGERITVLGNPAGSGIAILTSCSTLATNHLDVYNGENPIGSFQGPVECSSS